VKQSCSSVRFLRRRGHTYATAFVFPTCVAVFIAEYASAKTSSFQSGVPIVRARMLLRSGVVFEMPVFKVLPRARRVGEPPDDARHLALTRWW